MARARTIKPQFWTSEQIMLLEIPTRLLFIGLWNFSDDNGVHPASYIQIKAEIFPADLFTLHDIERMINDLIDKKLINEYCVGESTYWIVTGWEKHQKVDKPTAIYPLPSTETSCRKPT